MSPIYLDYNASTPIDKEVAAAMLPFLHEYHGNPGSSHWYGRKCREAIEQARQQVAALIGCRGDEIVFTSGGSEANNFAIQGVAFANHNDRNYLITSAIEHPAVAQVCKHLEQHGYRTTYLPVDHTGRVSPDDLKATLTSRTALVSIMHANNEVGTIQPISKLAEIAHAHDLIFHTDAAQSLGKIPVNVDELGVDLLSIAGHKLYAPIGVGALYVRRGTKLQKFIHGAGQERGWRAGTENVLGIVGLGKACELAQRDFDKNRAYLATMRQRLIEGLQQSPEGIRVNTPLDNSLPNTLSVSFRGVQAYELLQRIGDHLAVSAGSACHSDSVEISSVLRAMHVPQDFALGTLRLSVGKQTTATEIVQAVEILAEVVKELRTD